MKYFVQCFIKWFQIYDPFEHCRRLASFLFILFICLFIYLWLCWVFVSVPGLSLVAASGGHSSSRCVGLSLSWPLLLRGTGSRCAGSVVVAHGPSCSAACGIFPDQGSNPCPLHWQADSQPLHHQGSPYFYCNDENYDNQWVNCLIQDLSAHQRLSFLWPLASWFFSSLFNYRCLFRGSDKNLNLFYNHSFYVFQTLFLRILLSSSHVLSVKCVWSTSVLVWLLIVSLT